VTRKFLVVSAGHDPASASLRRALARGARAEGGPCLTGRCGRAAVPTNLAKRLAVPLFMAVACLAPQGRAQTMKQCAVIDNIDPTVPWQTVQPAVLQWRWAVCRYPASVSSTPSLDLIWGWRNLTGRPIEFSYAISTQPGQCSSQSVPGVSEAQGGSLRAGGEEGGDLSGDYWGLPLSSWTGRVYVCVYSLAYTDTQDNSRWIVMPPDVRQEIAQQQAAAQQAALAQQQARQDSLRAAAQQQQQEQAAQRQAQLSERERQIEAQTAASQAQIGAQQAAVVHIIQGVGGRLAASADSRKAAAQADSETPADTAGTGALERSSVFPAGAVQIASASTLVHPFPADPANQVALNPFYAAVVRTSVAARIRPNFNPFNDNYVAVSIYAVRTDSGLEPTPPSGLAVAYNYDGPPGGQLSFIARDQDARGLVWEVPPGVYLLAAWTTKAKPGRRRNWQQLPLETALSSTQYVSSASGFTFDDGGDGMLRLGVLVMPTGYLRDFPRVVPLSTTQPRPSR